MSAPSGPSDKAEVPATFDRAAFERVLARAAELADHEGLTETQIIEVGREVGIPAEFVRHAIAEERAHGAPEAESSMVTRIVGQRWASASRIVTTSTSQALAALDRWMQAEECLRQKRRVSDRIAWEARRDLVGNIKRGINLSGRHYTLARVTDVTASVAELGERRTLVRLEADLHTPRRRAFTGAVALAGAGTAGAAAPFLVAALLSPVAIPIAISSIVLGGAGLVGSMSAARRHRRLIERVHLALEQALDQVDLSPPAQASMIGLLTDVVLGPR